VRDAHGAHPGAPISPWRSALTRIERLNTVAVGQLAVATAGVIRVEEVVVVILVRLPLGEGEENRERHEGEHEAERIIVDAEGLAGTLTTRLVASKRTEVEGAVDAKHRLGVSSLRVDGDGQGRRGRGKLGQRLLQLGRGGQLEALGGHDEREEREALHG